MRFISVWILPVECLRISISPAELLNGKSEKASAPDQSPSPDNFNKILIYVLKDKALSFWRNKFVTQFFRQMIRQIFWCYGFCKNILNACICNF
jgi:hypothetical protein